MDHLGVGGEVRIGPLSPHGFAVTHLWMIALQISFLLAGAHVSSVLGGRLGEIH